MISVIFNMLFDRDKNTKCITIVKNRAVSDKYNMIEKNQKQQVFETCLSKYFEKRKGLNINKRQKLPDILSVDLVGDNSRNLSTRIVNRCCSKIF